MGKLLFLIILFLSTIFTGCSKQYHKIYIQEDTVSLFRNPCMGWGIYDDANDEVQNADNYWDKQGYIASKYASFLYIRWRWSDMEPEEGKYAWIYDENYKKLIQGALDRGLKLCFRIYNNGQDNIKQSTPDYVRKAGAKGYKVTGIGGKELWTPYPDDSIFQEKLEKFVKAFAEEYDNPDIVDFIDGYNLGWWGECHHIKLQDQNKIERVFDWITTLYSSNFKNVNLLLPFGSQIGFDIEKKIAIDEKGYGMRRDGLGSMWFSEQERIITSKMYGKTLLVGESCYWGTSDDNCKPFASDTYYQLKTWRDVYEKSYNDAIIGHFNTLDLREIAESKGWTSKAEDLVNGFIRKGGYRILPYSLTLPVYVDSNENITINHTWKNSGNGYLPNNMKNWNYKYKPAFALLDVNGKVVKSWIDDYAEPSEWLCGEKHSYDFIIQLNNIPKGKYKWAVAIVDKTKNNTPAIKLAINDNEQIKGWSIVGDVLVR